LCNDNVKRIFGGGFSVYEPVASRSLRYALFAPYYLEYELDLPSVTKKKLQKKHCSSSGKKEGAA